MSFNLTKLVLSKQCGGAVAKALLLVMSGHASADGSEVYPSVATLSAEAELSERKTRLLLADFRARGLIAVTGKHPCRNGYTTKYRLCVEAIDALPDCSAKPAGKRPTGASGASVHSMHMTGAPHAPQEVHQMHPNKSGNKSENKPADSESINDAFEAAWRMWPIAPRPSSRPESRRLWMSLEPIHGSDRLLVAVGEYLRSDDANRKGKLYVRKLQNWLREDASTWIERSSNISAPVETRVALPTAPDWWAATASDLHSYDSPHWLRYGSRCIAIDGALPAISAPTEHIRDMMQKRLDMRGHQITVHLRPPSQTEAAASESAKRAHSI